MSAAAPTVDAGAAAPAKKGKKKLVVMLAIALLVVLAGGGGAVFFMKKKAHDAPGDEAAAPAAEHTTARHDSKHPPTFLPLDPFVVNLADREAERYAQIGITLEIEDAKFADDMKAYMPAIRNGILMILAHKTSSELLERSGKEKLAGQIQREAARSMGIEIDEPDDEDEAAAADGAATKHKAGNDEATPKKSAKAKAKARARKAKADANPVRHVHFANFIIQ